MVGEIPSYNRVWGENSICECALQKLCIALTFIRKTDLQGLLAQKLFFKRRQVSNCTQ